MRRPLCARDMELDVKAAQEARNKLVDFKETNISTDAGAGTSTEEQHGSLHGAQGVGRGVEPALGAEGVWVWAEERGVTLDDPGIATDDGTAGNKVVKDVHALGWHDALEKQARGGVEAEGFLDDGVEVGELLGLRPRHRFVGARGDDAGTDAGIELVEKGSVDAWVLGEEIEDGSERDSGGFGAGKDKGSAGGENAGVVHEGVVMTGLSESGKQIDALWICLFVIGQAKAFDLFYLAGALVGAFHGEACDGVHTLVQADALGEENNGILPEKTIEYWHLPNGRDVIEEMTEICEDVVYIRIALDEAQPFAPCHFSDYVKSKELQPLAKITASASTGVEFFSSVEPVGQGRSYEWFVVDERAHGEGMIDAPTVLCMKALVSGGKQRKQTSAIDDGTLHWVEVRLGDALVQPVNLLDRFWIGK